MKETIRILVVDDDTGMVKTLVDILRARSFAAEPAFSSPEAMAKAAQTRFDCLLTDIRMPGIDGLELIRSIRNRQPDLVVLLMTAYSSDALVQEGLREGAVACLTKPLDIDALLEFLDSLRKEPSIVIVDDDPEFCRTLGDILQQRGLRVTLVTVPETAMRSIGAGGQVVLLDIKVQTSDSLQLFEDIRSAYPHVPIILTTGYREETASAIQQALKGRGCPCLYKPLEIEELLKILGDLWHRELGRILGQPTYAV